MLGGTLLEEVDTFPYLGSLINRQGGTDADVKSGIGKTRAALAPLENILKSRFITACTKVHLLNSNVKLVLLSRLLSIAAYERSFDTLARHHRQQRTNRLPQHTERRHSSTLDVVKPLVLYIEKLILSQVC